MSRARRGAGALILALLLAGAIAAPAPGAALKQVGGFQSRSTSTGAPGFPDLLFVVEQQGRIKVINAGKRAAAPSSTSPGCVNYGGEQGLLSIAFPPDYKRNRRFYVYYTDSAGRPADRRVQAPRQPGRRATGSRRTVIDIPHRVNSNHNGGEIQFLGQHLYLSHRGRRLGRRSAQQRQEPRQPARQAPPDRSPQRAAAAAAYRVPRSNPFVGRDGRDEIFSYGLRNPFRFSFDTATAAKPTDRDRRRRPGALRGDRLRDGERARGGNFGWDAFEGFAPYELRRAACAEELAEPTRSSPTAGSGCAVIGGYVVRDRSLGALFGRYLFADNCDGTIRSLSPRLGRVSSAAADRPQRLLAHPRSARTADGRVYVTSLEGPVYRIVPGG